MAKLINGSGNPAVYANEDADLIAALAGNTTAIAAVGSEYAATQEDANTIGLADGVIITKEGRRIQLDEGRIDLFTIPTGTAGTTSYYIIGYKLSTDLQSKQTCETFVQKMDSSSATITEDTFKGGATDVYVSVYRVVQNGLNIDSINLLLPKLSNVGQLNSNLTANNKGFKADYQNSKYGFTVDGTFHPFSSGAVLIGTYSANTTINVSAYGATSANQFILVPSQSVNGHNNTPVSVTGNQTHVDCYGYFNLGSLSLSGSSLTITLPTCSGRALGTEYSGYVFDVSSGGITIPCKLYFIG